MVESKSKILIFRIGQLRFGLPVQNLVRILNMMQINPLANRPRFINGVIDYFGELIAVVDLRQRLDLEDEPLKLQDLFILVQTSKRKLALIVNEVLDIVPFDEEQQINSKTIDEGINFVHLLNDEQGVIFIYDIESLLSIEEDVALETYFQTIERDLDCV